MTDNAAEEPIRVNIRQLVSIKLRDTEGNEYMFRIRGTTKLKKVMDTYCTRMGVQEGYFRFLFGGQTVNDEDTPDSLGIQELDWLDVLLAK